MLKQTKDYRLKAWIDWEPIRSWKECTDCSGTGRVGGGFKDLDGERVCSSCWGSKGHWKDPEIPAPEIPVELILHMRRAWDEFFKEELPTEGYYIDWKNTVRECDERIKIVNDNGSLIVRILDESNYVLFSSKFFHTFEEAMEHATK